MSTRRPWSIMAALACVVLALAACAPRAPEAKPAPPAATAALKPAEVARPAAVTQAPKPAVVDKRVPKLTIAVPLDSGPLNTYSSDSVYDWMVELVYDKLLSPSPYVDKPTGGLAESATQIDPSTWVVKLRDGVKWHDGKPFTADDVVFTYVTYRDGSPSRWTHHVNDVPKIDQIVAEDARTVKFSCNYPCPLLGAITFADLPILPKHIWENIKEPQTYRELPVGTGPYKLVEMRPDQLYRFQINEAYFLGKPLVDELVMPIIKDPTATFTALKTGEIDIAARDVPPELRAELGRTPGMSLMAVTSLSLVEWKLNYEKPPFDQHEFRRALSLMVDRQAIVDSILLGQGVPGTKGYTHPNSPFTDPKASTPFDRNEARKILDGLQFIDRNNDGIRETPDGQALELALTVPASEPVWIRVAELIAKQALDVGVRLTVQPLDVGTVRRMSSARTFETFLNESSPHGVADPDQFIMSHRSGSLWKAGRSYPEWEALFEEWKKTTDLDSRKQVSHKMQALYNQQPTSVPLYYPATTFAFRSASYDQWAESRGYGIVNKWSLLPAAARTGAVVTP